MKLAEVAAKLQESTTTPTELSTLLMELAADYAYKGGELSELLAHKATLWPKLREDAGSDKQADKRWDATANGIIEMRLRLELKSSEKLMSAIKTRLRILEAEARNQF